MIISWTAFKGYIEARSLSVQVAQDTEAYYLAATDCAFRCILNRNNPNEDLEDFETNFKPASNVAPTGLVEVRKAPSFGANTFTHTDGRTYTLFARNTGNKFTMRPGDNEVSYTATYPWVKVVGLEIVGCTELDVGEMKVYDTAQGTYTGVPDLLINQFGYTLNLPNGFYKRESIFEANLYQGMVIKMNYHSVSQSEKVVGINFIMNEAKL